LRPRKKVKQTYKEEGQFFALPHAVANHPDYISLSWAARSLLSDMGILCNGFNNGNISIALSTMKKRGWNSEGVIDRAKKELLVKDWIRLTRQGGKRKCSLFAISWKPLNETKNELDIDPKHYKPRSLKS
jgi:hypothetical protein